MLSNDAQTLLYELCKEYTARRNVKIPRARARQFRSAQSVQENFAPHLYTEDVVDILRELNRNGYVSNSYGDNTVVRCSLTDEAVTLFESLPSKALSNASNFIIQIANIVLPLISK